MIKEAFAQSNNLGDHFGFGWLTSLGEAFSYLIKPAFAIASVAVLIYFLVGTTRLILSGGDKNAIAAGRDMIVHALIGFILLIIMFLIVQFLFEFLGIQGFRLIG